LHKNYPNIIVEGREFKADSQFLNTHTVSHQCSIALCNFGLPEQDIFLSRLKGDNLKLVMGVGGSFDYLTQSVQRAPRILQTLGLEWFWRLLQQPQRWKRILNAVFVFPLIAIFYNRNT
jgi:N-acetylglucosaminyldiphosphoundecaprenol N-acetyl-beta-D-mannosaminyltransferase